MNKKELVIEAARELFTTYGYKKVSMDEIASTSHVTKKTIYTYFKDKEEIFNFFLEEELNKVKQEALTYLNQDLPFIEKVAQSIHVMLTLRKKSLFLNKNRENVNLFQKYDESLMQFIEEKINESILKKHIKDCDAHLTSFIIYKIFLSLLFEYDEEIDEKKVTKEIISILQNGLLN